MNMKIVYKNINHNNVSVFNNGKLYQQYLGNYGQFYGFNYNSDVTIILNSDPSVVKNFKTINYEGALGWELESMVASSNDKTLPIGKYVFQDNLASLETQIWSNTFKKKEDKYFANLINNSPATSPYKRTPAVTIFADGAEYP